MNAKFKRIETNEVLFLSFYLMNIQQKRKNLPVFILTNIVVCKTVHYAEMGLWIL